MPGIGHVAVGLATARLQPPPAGVRRWAWATGLVILACLPDIDVVAFRLGIPYSAPFGHRGAFHSLVFAALLGIVAGALARAMGMPSGRVALVSGLVVATHGLLDTLTDGGLGIALLWPFTNDRYFAPWQPIPVSPLGTRAVSARGLALMARECLLFLPLFVVAALPRRRHDGRVAG
jgi:inner membrane protein